MTTATQVKRALQPLLVRHPDLALAGRWVFVQPISHLFRGFIIDRTRGADVFSPSWSINETFDVSRSVGLSWGRQIYRPGLWLWSDPESVPKLLTVLENEVLSKIRHYDTIRKFVDDMPHLEQQHRSHDRHPLELRPYRKIVFDVALGDLAAARAIAGKHLATWRSPPAHFDDEQRAQCRRLVTLAELLESDDRAGLAALLHAWEATTIRNLKLAHLWEPTPFPLETGGE